MSLLLAPKIVSAAESCWDWLTFDAYGAVPALVEARVWPRSRAVEEEQVIAKREFMVDFTGLLIGIPIRSMTRQAV